MKRQGFFPYDTDDEDFVEKAGLLSASDIGSATHSGAGTAVYDSTGVTLGPNTKSGSYLEWDATFMGAFNWSEGMTISFDVERAIFGDATSENSDDTFFFSIDDTVNSVVFGKLIATHQWAVLSNGTALTTEQAECDNRDADTHINVTVSIKNSSIDIYFDRYHVIHEDLTSIVDLSTATFRLGADGDATFPGTNQAFKNIQFVARAMVIPIDWRLRQVVGVGDSFIRNGQYKKDNQHITGYQNDEISGLSALNTSFDRNMFVAIHRVLADKNYFIGNERIGYYGRGGLRINTATNANDLEARLDDMLDGVLGDAASYPAPAIQSSGGIVFMMGGANDVTDSATGAQFQTGYEDAIDRLVNYFDHILICEPIPKFSGDFVTEIDSYRTAVNTLPSYNSKVVLVTGLWQTFNDAGAYGVSGSLYNSDNIHPNMSGHIIIGTAIGNAIKANVL